MRVSCRSRQGRTDSRNTVESAQLADTERGDDDTEAVLDSSIAVDGIGTSEFVG